MNLLCVSGNLGKDAEVRNAGGTAVAGFSLAMKSGYGDKAQTIWLDCSIWGKQAESGLVQYLKKGQFVVLSGELGTREYEGKTYLTLRVATVTLGGKQDGQQSQAAQQRQQPAQQQRQAPAQQVAPIDYTDDIPF
jgi:single-strand DNA-binding protein